MARVMDPPREALDSLRQPLTAGERRVLEWFDDVLPKNWEIYVQPHLNGLRPDFVLLSPKNGIAVYEVKDWSGHGIEYFVDQREGHSRLMGRRGGQVFPLVKQDPTSKIDLYKNEIYRLYAPHLPADTGLGSIVAGTIFTEMSTGDASRLLEPLRRQLGHLNHERLYPVVGSELLGGTDDRTMRTLLPSFRTLDDRMSDSIANQLRHWLVEPSFSADQRVPLRQVMNKRQIDLVENKAGTKYRRVRGPAGSGKSLVLAGRAAELSKAGKRVLVVTYNITLMNYLLDLSVRYAQNGRVRKEITAINFHQWCRRVACFAGKMDEYNALWGDGGGVENDVSSEVVLSVQLAAKARTWANALEDDERWDAILLDEAQDFQLEWWLALRAAMPSDGSGEALIVADRQQNLYGVAPWTEESMSGAGFRGNWITLEHTYRMSPSLSRLAKEFVDRFLPDAESHRPISPAGEFEFKTKLKWHQIPRDQSPADHCVEALMSILQESTGDPVSVSDLVCIVDNEEIGKEVVDRLLKLQIRSIDTFGHSSERRKRNEQGRRKKLVFFQGDARVKVTTIHSFKGWESKALVVQISKAAGPDNLAMAYAAITRLKRDDRGCYLTVVCSAPELADYGRLWE